MKRLILTLMILAGVSFGYPTLFGPAGMPSTWAADSIMADYFTSTDSLYWYNTNYNFYLQQATGSAGNRDLFIIFKEEDGNEAAIGWDDGITGFHIDAIRYRVGASVDNAVQVSATGTAGYIETLGTMVNLYLIPNSGGASGTIYLGYNKGDKVLLNGSELHTTDVTNTTTPYTVAAGVYMLINNVSSAATVNLPAVASHDGRMLVIKNIASDNVTVDGNASELIDGSETQTLAQWDSITLYCDGTAWYII
jgi:hypothetical protein